jgi:lysyl-tRNA synthetase class I
VAVDDVGRAYLIDSVKLSSNIVRAIDGVPPEGFNYELFLDEDGQKISKTKGNGLTMDEWMRYGAPESLAYYVRQVLKFADRYGVLLRERGYSKLTERWSKEEHAIANEFLMHARAILRERNDAAAEGRAVSIIEGRHRELPYSNIKRTLKSRIRPPGRSR